MKINPDILIGQRVCLREMKEEDVQYVVEWRNDPEIGKWFFYQNRLTIEKYLKWFRRRKTDRLDYIICDKKNMRPIGTINFKNIEKDKAEAGKMLGNKNYWKKGFAKEAFSLWVKMGFNILKLKSIYLKTMVNNIANIKLNEKLGFEVIDMIKVTIKPKLNKVDAFVMELKHKKFLEKQLHKK